MARYLFRFAGVETKAAAQLRSSKKLRGKCVVSSRYFYRSSGRGECSFVGNGGWPNGTLREEFLIEPAVVSRGRRMSRDLILSEPIVFEDKIITHSSSPFKNYNVGRLWGDVRSSSET